MIQPYELHRTLARAFEHPNDGRILFRAEKDASGMVQVIVQSPTPPDWSRIKAEEGYIKGRDEAKAIALQGLNAGQILRFRLKCRPSRRVASSSDRQKGRRMILTARTEINDWLIRKGADNGFEVIEASFARIAWRDTKDGGDDRLLGCVQFDGTLRVTDPDKLRQAVFNGLGIQKAYGFGLLSLSRA